MADAPDKSAEKKPGAMDKIKKLLPILFVVLNLGVCGGGMYFVFLATVGWKFPALTEEEELKHVESDRETRDNSPIVYTMDKFTVNLEGNPKRIIQIEVSLEMLDDKGFEEVVTLGPQSRDSIVRILNGKNFTELETLQGKLFLKDQIASTINQLLVAGVVKSVYFSEFVVQ